MPTAKSNIKKIWKPRYEYFMIHHRNDGNSQIYCTIYDLNIIIIINEKKLEDAKQAIQFKNKHTRTSKKFKNQN